MSFLLGELCENQSSLRIEEDLLKKLHFIAAYEGRSANMEIKQLIKRHIEEFEKKHGEIKDLK